MTIVLNTDFGADPFPTATVPWVDEATITGCIGDGEVDAAMIAQATTEILRALSGNRYGIRRGTVRPYRMSGGCIVGMNPVPTGWPEQPWSAGAGIAWGTLGCDGGKFLLDAPGTVLAVKVDGVALVAGTDWRMYDSRLLVRAGGACWPMWQDLSLPDTDVGTWSITYESGQAVPAGGILAAQQMGCEFAKLFTGQGGCALPTGWQSVARQGITINRESIKEMLDDGRTGLTFVDQWLNAVNPHNIRRRARIKGPESYFEARET